MKKAPILSRITSAMFFSTVPMMANSRVERQGSILISDDTDF